MISLGLGKKAWSWYSNIVGIQHLAVEVQVSVNVFSLLILLPLFPASATSRADLTSTADLRQSDGEHVQHFICGCQLYLLAVAECRHVPHLFLQLLNGW